MIVVDASAFLELLLRTASGLTVERLLLTDVAAAPHLIDAEVLHRIVLFGKHGVMQRHEVETAVRELADAPIDRFDHRPLLPRARELSEAISGYDALYAALADLTGATLVTGDRAFARTARAQLGLAVADI
ncbi:MAG: type II toxin-antitoxin system VapC family toxin [Acidimicrobiia bacterium]